MSASSYNIRSDYDPILKEMDENGECPELRGCGCIPTILIVDDNPFNLSI